MTTIDPADDLCPVCLSRGLRDLCDPWRGQSMLSDMRTTSARLGRAACINCGLVRRRALPAIEAQRAVYDEAYVLFAGAPTDHMRRRQSAIAGWIIDGLRGSSPTRILEFGCGDGSLLEAFGAVFPSASLRGVEPAPPAVQEAKRRGVDVVAGFAEDIPAGAADLCLSVNVIEHVAEPLEFLGSMRRAVRQEGWVVVACPDGDVPNYELLFYDHIFSFGRHALEVLCARAGLVVVTSQKAPTAIGPFHLVVARWARDGEGLPQAIDPAGLDMAAIKNDYLAGWARLEDVLLARIGDAERVIMFGNGDVTGLLRVYAPAVWAAVEACVVDGEQAAQSFLDRPLRGYGSLPGPRTIVLGTRPGSQDAVARRLAADGHRVVRWDDIIAA